MTARPGTTTGSTGTVHPTARAAAPTRAAVPVAGELDEATLVARARDRDVESFGVLVRRYQRRIYALCVRMLGGAGAEAEDATQDVFLAAWRRLPELEQDGAFGGWLYRAATHRCLNVLRSRRPATELNETTALTDALQHLPPQQRACWLLREVHGRSYEEIARIVDATPGAVRGRIARARIDLAEVMAPWR